MGLPLLAFLLFEAIQTAQGALYQPSKQTSPAENTPDEANGWTPKPTEPPRLRGQSRYGAMGMNELFKRSSADPDDIATCGWYNGDADSPLTCLPTSGTPYACAYITTPAPQWFACCPTDENGEVDWPNCPYYDTCYDFDSYSAPNTWTGSYAYAPEATSYFYCPKQYPACATISLFDNGGSTYQHIYCDTSSIDWTVLQSTESGSASASGSESSQPVSSDAPNSVPQAPTTVTVTQSNPAGNGPTIGSSSSSTATATGGGGGGSSSNTGAIAGGVVGGVAGIALLGAAIGYLVYRKRKARVEPMREVSIYSNNYSNAGYSGSQSQAYSGSQGYNGSPAQGYSVPQSNYGNNY